MNINKLLCKHMDYGDKGHVTLGNVGEYLCKRFVEASILGFIGGVYVYGGWIFYNGARIVAALSSADETAIIVFYSVSIWLALLASYYVAKKLSAIRVATCERKDEDAKERCGMI